MKKLRVTLAVGFVTKLTLILQITWKVSESWRLTYEGLKIVLLRFIPNAFKNLFNVTESVCVMVNKQHENFRKLLQHFSSLTVAPEAHEHGNLNVQLNKIVPYLAIDYLQQISSHREGETKKRGLMILNYQGFWLIELPCYQIYSIRWWMFPFKVIAFLGGGNSKV